MKAEYNTRQRALILDFLKENSAHVSVRDIIEHLKEQGIKVGTATVYRTLDKLCALGVVRKFVVDERSGACYQYTHGAECDEHFHLKCVSCGALIHMDCNFLAEMEKHIFEDHGFTVSSGKTVIYGLCANCNPDKSKSAKTSELCCHHKH
jgi:Fur family ferric uptake transcriptional regulator